MHPSISSFPNREFYDSKVLDAPNVKERTYEKCFLQGSMYGSYSFINVTNGIEDQDSKHSTKNMVEVAVVAEIVSNLFKGLLRSVRSIDGFQGGEEDLIIISTVRCNRVDLWASFPIIKEPMHGLWILGNGATLMNSNDSWRKLVLDTKAPGCFYNANDDNNLAQAVVGALVELNQLDTILKIDSPLFSNTRWKVCCWIISLNLYY
ncbi:Helicase SEN1 [Camellia lanceoleosa]|nr:Helicase SEN1 [Camellia lanceoleosa]